MAIWVRVKISTAISETMMVIRCGFTNCINLLITRPSKAEPNISSPLDVVVMPPAPVIARPESPIGARPVSKLEIIQRPIAAALG